MSKVKRIISVILFACLMVGMLSRISFVLSDKTSYHQFSDFQKEPDNDVLFLGTSHVYNGVNPMALWEQYGITAYNLATPGSKIPMQYWVLENALRSCKPKRVVIDIFRLNADDKVLDSPLGYIHSATDWIPNGILRARMLYDLFMTGAERSQFHQKMHFIMPLFTYHSRWMELEQKDFAPQPSPCKGSGFSFTVCQEETDVPITVTQKAQEQTVGEVYLRRIIDRCRADGIDVTLINLSFNMNENREYLNRAEDIAEEYGIDFLDFTTDYPGMLNPMSDYSTGGNNSHLNFSGACRLSAVLGKYLHDTCNIPDRREDVRFAKKWNQYDDRYRAFCRESVKGEDALEKYLVGACNRDYVAAVLQQPGSVLIEKSPYRDVFENLGFDPEHMGEVQYSEKGQFAGNILVEDGRLCYAAEGEKQLCPSTDSDAPAPLQIVLVDKTGGTLIDAASFALDETGSVIRLR